MLLHEKIKDNIKESMKMRDKVRLEVMRGILSSFTNELVSKKKTPQDTLTDEEALGVITRLAKQRKDSIKQFTEGGRADLAEEEQAQLAILEEFLPEQMGISEIEIFVKKKYAEFQPKDISKKGMFMASIMKELKGKADGALVKEEVDKLFI